jgi:uncharacterized membrane protein YccC
MRVTVAALLSLTIAQFLNLPMPLWAVLTALIVTEMSVGRSLKTVVDYLGGTFGGAVYGAVLSALVPHVNEIGLLVVLAFAVAPLAMIMAVNPSLKVAPITAVLVILVPAITHTSSFVSAFDRVLEVTLGAVVSFVVTFLILPSKAHGLATEAAAHTLDQIARAFGDLLVGLEQGLDNEALHRMQDGIGQALVQLGNIGQEADRERSARLVTQPETGPLLRTLLRLRHDLVMIGRVTLVPPPPAILARLRLPLRDVAATVAEFLRASGEALKTRRQPPSLADVEAALNAFAGEHATVRAEGLTRSLPSDGAERFFTLEFGLEQFHQNLRDLKERVTEWAEAPKPTR